MAAGKHLQGWWGQDAGHSEIMLTHGQPAMVGNGRQPGAGSRRVEKVVRPR